ncbi:MAG: hypothetical protein M1825_006196 [Sarcosagium campestre]|nr:MAG: hypothetical protein M1825_006196 [Sarcosagium campestre]
MVLLMGSYTDINNFGIIISPAADTDLATFLNEVPGSTEKQSMLAGFFGCLASAVEYLHAKNIQIRHKDIKPANILIKEDTVLINDFGLARDYSDDDCSTTKGPDVWGTKVYFAPEVADKRPRNTSSDIWSLGCVFLEMMTALKGKTVQTLRKLFDNRGRSGCYWQNQGLTTQWIYALENEEPIASNEPLKWIRAMLQNDPKSRPKARDLVREIVHHAQRVGPGAGFCQTCCLGEKDNDDLEPGTGQDGIQNKLYSPELPYARLRELITDERPPRDAADDSMEIPSSGSTGEMFSPEINQTSTTDEVAILAKKYGVSIERPDDEASIGKWALFYGILTGDIHLVREAFQREVEVDTPGRVWTREDGSVMTMQTPLLIAAELGHINIVEVLLDHGAQIQVKGGWTALHSAAHSGHVQVVKLLLDRGAAIDACPDDWITALFATVSVDTDFTTVDEAALYAVVKVLLERGSNPRFTIKEPHYTWSILDEAALTGRYNIASLILEYLQLDTDSTLISTALSSAVRYNRADLTELFLESGGDANFRSWNGRTVLHHAAFDGNCQIVKVLLKGNANIDSRDDDGITPIEIARREGESQVVDILNDARDKILQK